MYKSKSISKYTSLLFFFIVFNSHAQTDGEQLYVQSCMICHADDGTGSMPGVADLTVNRSWATEQEAKLVLRLKQGINSPKTEISMPPKGGNPELSDKDLREIIRYMRASFLQ